MWAAWSQATGSGARSRGAAPSGIASGTAGGLIGRQPVTHRLLLLLYASKALILLPITLKQVFTLLILIISHPPSLFWYWDNPRSRWGDDSSKGSLTPVRLVVSRDLSGRLFRKCIL